MPRGLRGFGKGFSSIPTQHVYKAQEGQLPVNRSFLRDPSIQGPPELQSTYPTGQQLRFPDGTQVNQNVINAGENSPLDGMGSNTYTQYGENGNPTKRIKEGPTGQNKWSGSPLHKSMGRRGANPKASGKRKSSPKTGGSKPAHGHGPKGPKAGKNPKGQGPKKQTQFLA